MQIRGSTVSWCLVFHDHFFYVRACFSTFSRCTRFFFYEIVKTLKRWLAFSRHVIFADIFSFLFHATLWRIRDTASKRYKVVDYSVNHWKFIHLRKQAAFHETSLILYPRYLSIYLSPWLYVRGRGEKYNKIRRWVSLFVSGLYSSTDFCVGIYK